MQIFLATYLVTYFFHDFWTLSDPQARQEQMIQFMKNLGLMGAMLIVIANGTGPIAAWTGGRRGLEESPPGESHPGGFDLVREEASVTTARTKYEQSDRWRRHVREAIVTANLNTRPVMRP